MTTKTNNGRKTTQTIDSLSLRTTATPKTQSFSVGTIVYSTEWSDEGGSNEQRFFLVVQRTAPNAWLVPVAKYARTTITDERFQCVLEVRPALLSGEPLMLPNTPHGYTIPFRVSVGKSRQVKRPFLYRHRGRFIAFPYSPHMKLLDRRIR